MKFRPMKLAIVALGAGAMVLGTTGIVAASVPPNTTIKGALAPSTTMQFQGTISGIATTVTCTGFKAKGKVVAGDTTKMDIPPVKITGCTDSLGGTDTVKTNDTHGSWELTTSGTNTLNLVVPKEGATFTTSALAGCVITVAPTTPQNIAGVYSSSAGSDTVTNSSFKVKGNSICSASSSTASATVDFTPNPGTIPPFVS